MNGGNITYFNSFKVEHIPREIKNLIDNKNITTKFLKIQAYDSVRGYFCIGFIDFTLECMTLLEYTNLFSPDK